MRALPPHRLTQVAPGVRVMPLRSPTLPPATHTNAWILGRTDVVVVDPASPWPQPRQALLDALRGTRVSAILLTHHHHDHTGGVEHLALHSGAPVIAHAHTAAVVEFPVDAHLDEGDTIHTDQDRWRVLHTPGHARGHLCLHRGDGMVIAGDMVAGEGTIVLDPPEGHLGDYLHHLQRLADLGPTTLLPAHGPPIPDGPTLLRRYIEHRHERSDQVRAALAGHAPARARDLVAHIYPDVPTPLHPVAARQVLCHLRWLRERGEARVVDDRPGGAEDQWVPERTGLEEA